MEALFNKNTCNYKYVSLGCYEVAIYLNVYWIKRKHSIHKITEGMFKKLINKEIQC